MTKTPRPCHVTDTNCRRQSRAFMWCVKHGILPEKDDVGWFCRVPGTYLGCNGDTPVEAVLAAIRKHGRIMFLGDTDGT